MHNVAIHFASGAAFFSGAGCLLAGAIAVTYGRHRFVRPAGRLLVLLGVFMIVASATPLPFWAWAVWGTFFLFWIGTLFVRAKAGEKWRAVGLAICISTTCVVALWELSYQVPPRIAPGRWERLVVIGDSLSAEDFTEGGDPWPTLLARDEGIRVVNLAFSGATAASAEKRLSPEDVAGALVLLEIGGNDLLGATSPEKFEESLDRLLTKVCRADNAVAMLELPLPPLYNRFGEIQRRLARKHGVTLIPKRYFAGVLAGSGATLDSLHLSAQGHKQMSQTIVSLLHPSLTPDR